MIRGPQAEVAGDVQHAVPADQASDVQLPRLGVGKIGVGVDGVPANVAFRIGLSDHRADRSVPKHPEEHRLTVLEAGAQQRGGGEASAQRGRRSGGSRVANPRVFNRLGRDHGDGADFHAAAS